jgi:MtN3 and saliva related transmembrane protein
MDGNSTLTMLGLTAGALTTVALVPQVVRVFRLKSAGEFAWGYFGLFWTGLVLWIFYGIYRRDWPVILTNMVTLALSLAVGFLKVRYARRRGASSATASEP